MGDTIIRPWVIEQNRSWLKPNFRKHSLDMPICWMPLSNFLSIPWLYTFLAWVVPLGIKPLNLAVLMPSPINSVRQDWARHRQDHESLQILLFVLLLTHFCISSLFRGLTFSVMRHSQVEVGGKGSHDTKLLIYNSRHTWDMGDVRHGDRTTQL